MNIKISDKKLKEIKADLEIVYVVNKNLKHEYVKDASVLDQMNFSGEIDTTAFLPEKKRLYIGVENSETENLRIACALASREINKLKVKKAKVALYSQKDQGEGIRAMVEGFLLGVYSFDKHKSKAAEKMLQEIIFSTENYCKQKVDPVSLAEKIKEAEIIAENVNLARDIVNESPSDLTPVRFSEIARELAKKNGLAIKVYGKTELEKMGMGAFLGVNRASSYPPQLIYLTYAPKNARKKITLVGKGITYDTGGLSLKPSDSMLTMKMDMSGAAAILGVILAAKQLHLPIEVHAIIGATENAIGKDAYKPDDVLKAMNGKTIEIRNTDAEGRLVLADCLCLAQKENPDFILDIATLTGASMVALGEYTIGVMGFNDELKNEIMLSGDRAGELTASLPFNRYLAKLLSSQIADISNISSSKYGGAITAAIFLGEFIEKKNRDKWVHLDIAGPAYKEKVWGENPHGASGSGLRTIIEWAKSFC